MGSDQLKTQLKGYIAEIIVSEWLNGFGSVGVNISRNRALTGATDSILYQVDAALSFVVKYHLKDVLAEKEGYEILKEGSEKFARKHLVQPLFGTRTDAPILIIPYLISSSLHDVIFEKKASENWIVKEMYRDFLNTMKSLWKSSLSKTPPSLKNIYLKRLRQRLGEINADWNLRNIEQSDIVVNGKAVGNLGKIIAWIEKKLGEIEPKIYYSCITHGDEHAKNILLQNTDLGIYKESWVLIDSVRAAKQQDWIFSIAKILHWWEAYFAIESLKRDRKITTNCIIDKRGNVIKVQYDVKSFKRLFPPICKTLSNEVRKFAEEVGNNIFHESHTVWDSRLKIALFVNLFGAITRHTDGKKRFAIPILIGESLRYLKESPGLP